MAKAPPQHQTDQEYEEEPSVEAINLEGLIRGGPAGNSYANPSGGFSYLDNIAEILAGQYGATRGQVLLDQLLGNSPGAISRIPGEKEFKDSPTFIPPPSLSDTPYVPSHASDIPDQLSPFDRARREWMIPLDKGKPLDQALSPLMQRLLKGKM